MASNFAQLRRACWVAAIVAAVQTVAAGEPAGILGAERARVIMLRGEPRSHIVAGRIEYLLYPAERIVLRDNVVVEDDPLAVEAAPAAAATSPEGTAKTSASQEARSGPPVTPAGPAAGPAAVPVETKPAAEQGSAAPVAPGSQSGLKIISIRSPGSAPPAPEAASEPASSQSDNSVASPSDRGGTSSDAKAEAGAVAIEPASAKATAPSSAATTSAVEIVRKPPSEVSTATQTAMAAAAGSGGSDDIKESRRLVAPERPAIPPQKSPVPSRTPPVIPTVTESVFTARTYILALVIVVGGVGYLAWRVRERRLALAASAVSRSPFAAPSVAASQGSRFTRELLDALGSNGFEELVSAYYVKTGVIASRTAGGPDRPVHIRISWKGEPQPFACVQCVPHPSGLIGPNPIQALCDVLAAEDVRRGYVVTSGKFSVPARDLAEEKHVTLLPGDIFIEKLNALPDSARAELMRQIASESSAPPAGA